MATALDYYRPFDGTPSAEADWRKIMLQAVTSGVLRGELNTMQVYGDSSGRQVKVKTGKVWMRGHYGENTAEKTITLTTNTSGNPRIDVIVVRVDFANNTIELDKLTGTPAGSPTAPALTQDATGAGVWEEALAYVAVANGYTTVAAGDVTDERHYAVTRHGAGGLPVAPTALSADVSVATTATADVDYTGWTVAAFLKANRRYRLVFFGVIVSATGSPNYTGQRLKIMEGATQKASTAVIAGTPILLSVAVDAPSEGIHTYKLQQHIATGVAATSVKILGTSSSDAAATTPAFYIEDLGPV